MSQPKLVPLMQLHSPMQFVVPQDTRLLQVLGDSVISSGIMRRGDTVEVHNFYSIDFDHHAQLALKVNVGAQSYFAIVKELSSELNELCFRLRQAETVKVVDRHACATMRADISRAVVRHCKGRLALVR
jgi:hypothetical protein